MHCDCPWQHTPALEVSMDVLLEICFHNLLIYQYLKPFLGFPSPYHSNCIIFQVFHLRIAPGNLNWLILCVLCSLLVPASIRNISFHNLTIVFDALGSPRSHSLLILFLTITWNHPPHWLISCHLQAQSLLVAGAEMFSAYMSLHRHFLPKEPLPNPGSVPVPPKYYVLNCVPLKKKKDVLKS